MRPKDGQLLSGLRVGRLFGISIFAHWSLIIIFGLIMVSLGVSVFPQWHPGWSTAMVWGIAFLAAFLFFVSIAVHEMSHALVGRAQGVPVERITLFLFGGIAHTTRHPESPKDEFLMSVVGPVTSLVIGLLATFAGSWLAAGSLEMADDPIQGLARVGPAATLLLWLGPVNIRDFDGDTLTGATVTISAGFEAGADLLSFTGHKAITASLDATGQVLTLSGTAPVSDYLAVLRSVTFSTSSDSPTEGPRTFEIQVNDGSSANGLSNVLTTTINLTAHNDAPTATAVNAGSVIEDGSLSTTIDLGSLIGDPDGDALTVTVGQGSMGGRATLNGNSLSIDVDASGAGYQSLAKGGTATETFAYTVTDSHGASTTENITVSIIGTNDAPILGGASTGPLAHVEGLAATRVAPYLVISDVDGNSIVGATVTISGGFDPAGDLLSFTNWGRITGSLDATGSVLTLAGPGTLAEYQAALRSVTYSTTSDTPVEGHRTIEVQVDDGRTDDALSNVLTSTVNVIANEAPTARAVSLSVNEGDVLNATIDLATLVGDADGDALTFALTTSSKGLATLSGTVATVSLDAGISYYESLGEGKTGTRAFDYAVTDAKGATTLETVTVTVNGVNDAPVLTLPDGRPTIGGAEFTVNTHVNDNQYAPSVAALSGGGFVAVWYGLDPNTGDADGYGVNAQMFDAQGNKCGSEFLLATTLTGSQALAAVTALPDGGFVATWQSPDGRGTGVFGQRFDAAGHPVGSEFRANDYTDGEQVKASVTALDNGDFVVAWASQAAYHSGLFGRVLKADGTSTSEFQITSAFNSPPEIAALAGGGFVATWTDPYDYSGSGILARVFNANGVGQGYGFRVNSVISANQTNPSVVGLSDGSFVVTWESPDSSYNGIFGQRFSATGVKLGGQFMVNTMTGGNQSLSDVAALSDGGFVVTWQSSGGPGDGIYGQQYAADGSRVGGQFRINEDNSVYQVVPSVSGLKDGGFVVAWQGTGDGSGGGITARVFRTDYVEGGPAIAVARELLIRDVDSYTLMGATVTISAGFEAGADLLSFTDMNGITGSLNAAGDVLTLSGEASVGTYLSALRTVTYSNTSDTPTEGERTFEIQVNDGSTSNALSNVVTTTINVVDNDDVINGGPGNDILSGLDGSEILFGAAGDDILSGGGGADVLTGGTGSDTFKIDDLSSSDIIKDFEVGPNGDMLDVSAVLEGFDPATSDLHDYLQVVDTLAGTDVKVNPDGQGVDFVQVVNMEGVHTTLDQLLANDQIIAG